MNTSKPLALLLLALSFSSAVLARQAGKHPTPLPPPATPTPVPAPIPAPTSDSQPTLISYQPTDGTTYALYFMDRKRLGLSLAREWATLQRQLRPLGLSPCQVAADINATPVKCGNGLIQFGANELYTYGRPLNLQKVPLTLTKGIKQVFSANFRSPKGLIPGDSIGRMVHVHFNQPVSQFAMNFDPGQTLAPSLGAVQFIVGTGKTAVSLKQSLLAGTPQWLGVQFPAGFTDLVVVPLDGATQAYVTDQFSVVTKAQFIP
ncbi:MAG: hypothetical protein LUQ11_02745 [Methylococcaceae bacterium]|nr:hypothetical protein [Methylococcaceae bacterium]